MKISIKKNYNFTTFFFFYGVPKSHYDLPYTFYIEIYVGKTLFCWIFVHFFHVQQTIFKDCMFSDSGWAFLTFGYHS